jgi:primosomal protein N' (replication factor Y)
VVVDQRDEEPGHGLLTDVLARAAHHALDGSRRVVCVLNRRGRARLLACRQCSELARCEVCGATVTERESRLVCERCGTERPLVCLHCGAARVRAVKPGVARVGDDLRALLPRARVGVVEAGADVDPAADVLVGTEAVLHRAGPGAPVGLVAFLELDQELLAPRIRAAEQALWLLVRAARLLGRPEDHGVLLLQTRLPDHEVIAAAVHGDPLAVTAAERERRRALGFPPYGGLAALRGDLDAVTAATTALRAVEGVTVLGPVADGSRALVRAASAEVLCDALALPAVNRAHAVGRLRVDVDPRRV